MQFGDLNAASGLQTLDGHLADKSYIGGYVPTQADLTVSKCGRVSSSPKVPYILNFIKLLSLTRRNSWARFSYEMERRMLMLFSFFNKVLKAMSGAPAGDYVNALRWFKHISSFVAAETAAFAKADFDVLVAGRG